MISRPLPVPLLGCPPPGPQLRSQSVFRWVGTAGTGSLGPSAGGDYDIQPGRPGRGVWLGSQDGGGASPQDLLLPRSAPIYGRAGAGFLICIAPPRTSFPTRVPKEWEFVLA